LEINRVKFFVRASVLLSMLLLSGCSDVWCWPFDCSSSKSSSGVVDDNSDDSDSDDTTTDPNPTEFNLNKVTWLHTNVSSWPVTSSLSVKISGGKVCHYFSAASKWPTAKIRHTSGTHDIYVNANPWVFAYKNGKWYGGTYEWMRPTDSCKPTKTVAGDHVKRAPLNGTWKPKSGETLYFMVSSLARFSSIKNVQERTDVVKVIWP
jgi:hypothetical protein